VSSIAHPLPPEPTLAWCLANIPGARSIREVTRLRGGLSAATHRIDVEMDGRAVGRFVLRRMVRDPTDTASIQLVRAALHALSGSGCGVATPEVVAIDAEAAQCDVPAILMTWLPGEPDLEPHDVDKKVDALARALAEFHRCAPACTPELPKFQVDFERRHTTVPPGIVAPDWTQAFRALEALTFSDPRLIHHDFHIGNTRFDSGKVCGIVDFEDAHCGPWQFDVTYCRMDLSMVFGADAGDLFLERYESARGGALDCLALWDLAGAVRAFPDPEMWLPSWHDLGRMDLTADIVRERLATFVDRALSRV
jgi:aminoglycoside phosphotransferase (APT) family kinase protein